jgi:predicted TPR repeat methyltransferase
LTEGMLAEMSRKRDDAIEAYRRLTQAAPKDPEGYFRLGRVLLSDRRERAAGRTSLETVVKLDPQGTWGDRARRLLAKR